MRSPTGRMILGGLRAGCRPIWSDPAASRQLLRGGPDGYFFSSVFNSIFCAIFPPNLVPSWLPESKKIDEKSIPKCLPKFRSIFV